MASIKSALAEAQAALHHLHSATRLDAEVLLAATLDTSRSHLHAWPDKILSEDQHRRFAEAVALRALGTPVAYITGNREFWSRSFAVTPHVLIPRPETELLVEIALDLVSGNPASDILDLGTGSGAIAVTLAAERPMLRIVATDISDDALRIAETNANRHTPGSIEFVRGDWFDALPQDTFDLIVSNPPYIREDDPHLLSEEIRFEPRAALVSGADGLDAIREIAAQSPEKLKVGGFVLLEHGYDQAEAVGALLSSRGFCNVRHYQDLQGHVRATSGQRSP